MAGLKKRFKAYGVNINTTVTGLIAAILALVNAFVELTPNQQEVITNVVLLLASLGLIQARDAEKTSKESGAE